MIFCCHGSPPDVSRQGWARAGHIAPRAAVADWRSRAAVDRRQARRVAALTIASSEIILYDRHVADASQCASSD